MKAVVCIKQVATLGDEIEFTPDGRGVDPDYLELALNEWDAYATEEAVRLKEAAVGEAECIVVTCGDGDAEEALRRCLAMGADRAVRVDAEGLGACDPISTARALAGLVEREAPDLVLCGVQSADAVQGATGTALAALLGLPRVAVVKKLEYDHAARRAVVHRELEGGLVDVMEVETPAVLTIQTGINEPRYATLRAIKQAERQPIELVEAAAARAPSARVRRMFSPPRGEGAEMLGDDPEAAAERIKQLVDERMR